MGVSFTEIEAAIGAVGRSGATAPVVIGGMVLTGLEVPDALVVGGRQNLVVHRLLGGGRVIDALGNDPDRLTLHGRFVGPEAQARAQAVERMRMAGAPVAFSAAGIGCQVWVAQFSYAYEARGAICAYRLVLERPSAAVSGAGSGGGATASALLGEDLGSALSSVTSAINGISSGAYVLSGQLGTVVGQVTPLATVLGAGGALASVTTALSATNALAQTGVNLASAPGSVSSVLSGLATAGVGLGAALTQTGDNLEGISVENGAALATVTANAGLASAAADAGGLVNRAAANTALAGGVSASLPLVAQ